MQSLAHVFGIAFNYCQMSQIVKKMMVRQTVTFEACTFHCSASVQDTQEFMVRIFKPLFNISKMNNFEFSLKKLDIPSVDQLNIYEYKFYDFNLSDNQTCQCILRMFMELDFINLFNISTNVSALSLSLFPLLTMLH